MAFVRPPCRPKISFASLDAVPREPHDERLDAVLTEAAYLEFGD